MKTLPVERLIYRSAAASEDAAAELDAILRVSIWNNARRRITGVLGFTAGHFVQVLEGPPEALDQLLEALRRDLRHFDLVVLDRAPASARLFPGWSMARVDLFDDHEIAAKHLTDGPGLTARLVELWRNGETAVA